MLLAPALLALALQTPAQAAPAVALADLVPPNTVAFVQAPSLERAAHCVGRLMHAFGPPGAPELDAATLLHMVEVPGDASAVDPARPIGLCLVLEEGASAEPMPAFLIPVLDADKYLKSVAAAGSGMQGVAKGGYVCVGVGGAPELPSAPAAIAKGLPEGEIAARLDLGRLVEQFREPIDGGLNEIEESVGSAAGAKNGLDTKAFAGVYVDWLRELVDSAETLDLALRLEGDELELGLVLTNAEGSALAGYGSKEKTGLRALAGMLEPESSISMLMGMDMPAMGKRLQPFMDKLGDAYPEALRPSMKLAFGRMSEIYDLFGSAQCLSMDIAPEGLRFDAFMLCKEPQKLIAAYRDMLDQMKVLAVTELPPREVGGVSVSSFRLKPDLAALQKDAGEEVPEEQLEKVMELVFGKGGAVLHVASKDGVTALVLGGGDEHLGASIAKLSSKGKPPAALARGLQQVGDLNPCLVMHYDIGRTLSGLRELFSAIMPGAGEGIPEIDLAFSLWGGVEGRVWRGAISTDLAGIAALVQKRAGKPR